MLSQYKSRQANTLLCQANVNFVNATQFYVKLIQFYHQNNYEYRVFASIGTLSETRSLKQPARLRVHLAFELWHTQRKNILKHFFKNDK